MMQISGVDYRHPIFVDSRIEHSHRSKSRDVQFADIVCLLQRKLEEFLDHYRSRHDTENSARSTVQSWGQHLHLRWNSAFQKHSLKLQMGRATQQRYGGQISFIKPWLVYWNQLKIEYQRLHVKKSCKRKKIALTLQSTAPLLEAGGAT